MAQTRKWSGLLIGAWLLVAAPAAAQLLSPGELAKAHAKLEGDDQCTKCHSSGKRIETSLCTSCHEDIGAELRDHEHLHGKNYASKPCAECHVEHRGRNYALIRWAGGSKDHFPHADTGWPLRDKHAETACMKCHTAKNARGVPTFLGLSQTCSSCHKDPHENRFGGECKQCHDERAWSHVDKQRFDHGKTRYPLVGKHQSVTCTKCHREPPKYRGIEFSACTSCHKDPHKGKYEGPCTGCHVESSWKDLHMQRSAHPVLSILGGHTSVKCETCHDRKIDEPPSKGARCVGCHAPVHKAKFSTNCAECHKQIQWLGLADFVGRQSHAQTAFLLKGKHQSVACARCHSPKLSAQKRYRQLVFNRCTACHEDSHKREFAAPDGGECAGCHDEQGWTPTLFGVETHATTRFTLLGRHVAVACGACHKQPRPRLDWRLSKQTCEGCHENPHGDQFSKEMAKGGCAQCHNAKDWKQPNIDHSTWPLTGAHSNAACASCHHTTSTDTQAGRVASYRGVPRECDGCHDDVHKGQFRLTDPVRACSVCHGTTTFKIARFEHKKLTGFALLGKHETVQCQECHKAETLRNGETVRRLRLGYTKCRDCHADPHTQEAH
ncbi:MAG TPA: hypothetical protein VF331_26090 [Polyangiales bacterium]